uniref:Uncharacterized protein n=1 Tax=viral metagenome TaxID=1070528 RepID=A0A6M3JMF3_9ZZZZ
MATAVQDMDIPDQVDIRSGDVTVGTVVISSGEIHILSGQVIAKTSGETISIASGPKILAAITDDAGTTFVAVGTPNTDGADVGESLYTQGFTYGYDAAISKWNRIRVNKSGQGALVVASSGQDYVLVKTSGEAPYTPAQGKSNLLLAVGSISGGIALASGACLTVTVIAPSKNSGDIYMGYSTSGQLPYSGYGAMLEPGASVSIPIANQGLVKGFAQVSGDKLSYTSVV